MSGRDWLSSTISSILRPAIWRPISSRYRVRPLTMSLAAWAAVPVRSVVKPILIGPGCAWGATGIIASAVTSTVTSSSRNVVVLMPGSSVNGNRSGFQLGIDVRAALPRHLVERHLGLAAVGEADDDRLGEHADRLHLAGHAAAAAARRLARRVDARQTAAQLLIGRELVEQAALEPAAVAEQAAVGQRHVLRLGHLHGDRLELLQMRRAAELPAAGADAVHHTGGVARANLAHLDPRVELVGEVADEVAEVDAVLGVEVHGHPALGAVQLDVHHLQRHAAAVG